MKRICGIYAIKNKINGKMYIGQSKDILTRWKQHCSHAIRGDVSYLIINALRKYGVENFDFTVLEECRPCDLDSKEIEYINVFNTYIGKDGGYGYNMTSGGDGKRGGGIRVSQYDLDGNFIRSYDSMTEAATACGIHKTQIAQCCKKTDGYRSAGNSQWRYSWDKSPDKCYHRDFQSVEQYSPEGDLIRRYDSCEEAARVNKASKGYIYSCCKITTPTFKNCVWVLSKSAV